MPQQDFSQVSVVLAARAAPRPDSSSSVMLEILTSAQFQAHQAATAGARLLPLSGLSYADDLAALGILPGSVPYLNVEGHFTAIRQPRRALLAARGRFSLSALHEVTIGVVEDIMWPGFAPAGDWRVGGGIEGGDYKHTTPDLFHTQTVTATAAADFASGEFAITFPDGFRAAVNADQRDTWTITVNSVAVGVYSFIVNTGGTADVISFTTVGGETINDIRAGLIADFNATANATAVGTISTTGAAGLVVRALLPGVANFLDLSAITGPGGLGVELSGVNTQDPQLDDTQVINALHAQVAAYLLTLTTPTYTVINAAPVLTVTSLIKWAFRSMSVQHPVITPDTFAIATTVQPRETVSETRDAINTLIMAGTHPSFTNGVSGGASILLNRVSPGSPITLTTTGPIGFEGNLVNFESNPVVELRVPHIESVRVEINPATPGFAWVGTYIFALLGEVVSVPIAASTTPIAAALAMELALAAAAGGKYTAAASGTSTILIADLTAGRPLLVTIALPDATAVTQTTAQASYGVRDDIIAAANESTDWYMLHNGAYNSLDPGHRTDQEEGAKQIAALQPRRIGSFQTDEAETVSTTFSVNSTDVIARLKNAAITRTHAVWHPSLDVASGISQYEAVNTKWLATVLTVKVGSIQWKGRLLDGNVHGIRWQNFNAPTNARDRDASWLERLEARQQNVMNGGYMLDGRIIDIVRALDTLTSNMENALLDVITQQNIVPFSPDGVAFGREAIQAEIDRGVIDGYVLPRSGLVTDPDLSLATDEERQRGIMPPFTFFAVVQAGTYQLAVNGEITQ